MGLRGGNPDLDAPAFPMGPQPIDAQRAEAFDVIGSQNLP